MCFLRSEVLDLFPVVLSSCSNLEMGLGALHSGTGIEGRFCAPGDSEDADV